MDEDKKLREIIREELRKLSGMTWGQRLGYIWDYYKPLMVALLLIIVAINVGLTIFHNKQQIDVIQVYMLDSNSMEIDTEEMAAEFADYIGGLQKHEVITIDTSLTGSQEDVSQYGMAMQVKLMALAGNGDIDLFLLDESVYQQYLEEGTIRSMDDVLSEEQKEKWSGLLVRDSGRIYGLKVQDSPVLQRYNAYNADTVYAAVALNGSNEEMCSEFLEYLLAENNTGGQDNG